MSTAPNFEVRRSDKRGRLQNDWLNAHFSFSFGSYQDSERNGFSALVALNEDFIQPRRGFDMHPHRNLEIFIIPLSGAVEHRDSLGNYAIVTPGEIQKMSAGAGISHSQMNASDCSIDHHLQIWIRPQTLNTKPYIEQRRFDTKQRIGRWQAIITPDGRNESLQVDQDASVHAIILQRDQRAIAYYDTGRNIYLHVVEGSVVIASPYQRYVELSSGDAIAFQSGADVVLQGTGDSTEVLLFNLPR